MTRSWNTIRIVGLAGLAIYLSQSPALFSKTAPAPKTTPDKLARDDKAQDLPRHDPRARHEHKPGGVLPTEGSEPCAPRAGHPYEWEMTGNEQASLQGDLAAVNACTGNFQMGGGISGLNYNSETDNTPPGDPGLLGGPFGWFWRDGSSAEIVEGNTMSRHNKARPRRIHPEISPGAPEVTLIEADGTPVLFDLLQTTGGKTYYENRNLMAVNLVYDPSGATPVWREQFPDGGELEYTNQKYGVQITSYTSPQGTQSWHYVFVSATGSPQDGEVDSLVDYKNQVLLKYGYYPPSSSAAGRLQYITPMGSSPWELVYDPETFEDLYEIHDSLGLLCTYIYDSHVVVFKQCADEITTFEMYLDGAFLHADEPSDQELTLQFAKNGNTTNAQFSDSWGVQGSSVLTFANQSVTSSITIPPYVQSFTNEDGETEKIVRNSQAMGTPPSYPGPVTQYVDFFGKTTQMNCDLVNGDPTGTCDDEILPDGEEYKYKPCAAGAANCPPVPPGLPPSAQTVTDAYGNVTSMKYLSQAFGTAQYGQAQEVSAVAADGTSLGTITENIVPGTAGVAVTDSLNGVTLQTATLNDAGTLVLFEQMPGETVAVTKLDNAHDLVNEITTTSPDESNEDVEEVNYDDAGMPGSYANVLFSGAVTEEDALHRVQAASFSSSSGPTTKEKITYSENPLTDDGEMLECADEDLAASAIDGWKIEPACDSEEPPVEDFVENEEGTFPAHVEGEPTCENAAVPVPSLDAGMDADADQGMPDAEPPPNFDDSGVDSAPPPGMDAGDASEDASEDDAARNDAGVVIPGCSYDEDMDCEEQGGDDALLEGCCWIYDEISDQLLYADWKFAACWDSLLGYWDDNGPSADCYGQGTWGSNCYLDTTVYPNAYFPPDPCAAYEDSAPDAKGHVRPPPHKSFTPGVSPGVKK